MLRGPDDKPTEQVLGDAIFGTWDGNNKRKRGLLERISTIERILYFTVPILVANALGVPTNIIGKVFAAHGGLVFTSHVVAFLLGVPK